MSLPFSAVAQQAADSEHYTDEAQRIYEKYGGAIYQIQVIDAASGRKTSIGTGFQFTNEGFIATNYHVVAEAIQRPKQNRVEYLKDDGSVGALEILTADVVHDLAIVRKAETGGVHVRLGSSKLRKGAKLFSLGNPHDIGFTIIEGTYNGLYDRSLYERIHFSGSLNPGMSGGPALDHRGRVVGINVSTAGNQISFLVPVEHLAELRDGLLGEDGEIAEDTAQDFIANAYKIIEGQLFENQADYMKTLLAQDWESEAFGPVQVPGRIANVFKCWGSPDHGEDDPYIHNRQHCAMQDSMFLDDNFMTGPLIYRYDHIKGDDDMNPLRFNSMYQENYSLPLDAFNNARSGDVTDFECNTRFVDLAERKWKTSFCLRQYRKYPKLFDMHVYMAMVGVPKEGLLVSVIAEGVGRDSALDFTRKFIEGIRPIDGAAAQDGAD